MENKQTPESVSIKALHAATRKELQQVTNKMNSLSIRAMHNLFETQRDLRRDEAKEWAHFLYDHRDSLNRLALSDPRAILNEALNGLPPGDWPPQDWWPPGKLPPRWALGSRGRTKLTSRNSRKNCSNCHPKRAYKSIFEGEIEPIPGLLPWIHCELMK